MCCRQSLINVVATCRRGGSPGVRAGRRARRRRAGGGDAGGELLVHGLDGDAPIVAHVVGEKDRRHAALSQLALDRVPVRQCGFQALMSHGTSQE